MQRFGRVILLASCMIQVGCGNVFPNHANNNRSNNVLVSEESAYCAGSQVFSGGSTLISASAQLSRFNDIGTGLTTTSIANIRFAEVQIFNELGTLVQCGETDMNGLIGATSDWLAQTHSVNGIQLPKRAGTYRLVVNSRGNNAFVKASVVNNPNNNQFYSISKSFTLTGNETSLSVVLPIASHHGSLEGGAFNILDQLVNANNFLRGNTSCPFCTNFSVAPKVSVFWTPGLSPGTYVGSSTTATSFFNRNSEPGFPVGMYVLGGISGSVCTDTDHFDNSVIVHEYGHFMEYSYAKSDSPGGYHDGNAVIDPRLAWSEGWADYFQAEVLGRNFYRDTISNSECGNATLAFPDFILFAQTPNQDVPLNPGEGAFREFSTSRTLFKATTAYQFSYIWNSFSDLTYGLGNSNFHFKNPGLFFQQLLFNITNPQRGNASWTIANAITTEAQRTDQNNYAFPVSPNLNSCYASLPTNFSFQSGVPVPEGAVSFGLLSNKYFQFYYDGNPQHSQITLHYASSSGKPYDLDLYLYQEDYAYGESSSIVQSSTYNFPESGGSSTWSGYETVSLAGRPAGHYMIDVLAYTINGATASTTNFYLQTNSGEFLCP